MAGKTYESLYKQQTEFYVKYFATTYAVEHIIVGVVAAVILYIIAFTPLGITFTLFGLLGPVFRFVLPAILAITFAALSALIDPGKKPLPVYLWGAVSYFFKPKVFIGGHQKMKHWKGEQIKIRQQTSYTTSVGPIQGPAMLIGSSNAIELKAAMVAEKVRGGVKLVQAGRKVSKKAIRLPYGRVVIRTEGRGRVVVRR